MQFLSNPTAGAGVTFPGGGGSGTSLTNTQTTIDFGATPVAEGSFTINDAGVTSTSYIQAWVMGDNTADNDVEAHRHAAASWRICITPSSGSFTLDITALIDLCWGTFKVRYSY